MLFILFRQVIDGLFMPAKVRNIFEKSKLILAYANHTAVNSEKKHTRGVWAELSNNDFSGFFVFIRCGRHLELDRHSKNRFHY